MTANGRRQILRPAQKGVTLVTFMTGFMQKLSNTGDFMLEVFAGTLSLAKGTCYWTTIEDCLVVRRTLAAWKCQWMDFGKFMLVSSKKTNLI